MNNGKPALYICMLVLAWITFSPAYGNDSVIPRLALIAGGDKRAETIAELVEARLSRERDLELIDRRQVRDMLAEQEWMLTADSVDDAMAVRVGTFLHCDLVVELQRVDVGEKAGELPAGWTLKAFATTTGIRLLDTTLPDGDTIEHTATLAAEAILKAVRSYTDGPALGRRTLTLGTIRNVSLLPEHARIGAMLKPLLERNLMRTGKFSLLF